MSRLTHEQGDCGFGCRWCLEEDAEPAPRCRLTVGTTGFADIMGIGTRQVQNWAAGRGKPADAKRLRQLLDLQYVLDLLGEIYDPEGSLMWLHARNRLLHGERPLDLLGSGRTDEVIGVLDRLADGNL